MTKLRPLPSELPALQGDRLWTIHDVSAFIAVPVNTIYAWRVRGEGPPAIRLGKHLRFSAAAVRDWVEQQEAC